MGREIQIMTWRFSWPPQDGAVVFLSQDANVSEDFHCGARNLGAGSRKGIMGNGKYVISGNGVFVWMSSDAVKLTQ